MIIKSPCIIDISHWEVPDWPNLDSRVMGVIMKATQGKFYVDPTFKNSWIGAGNRQIPRSAYHFFEANDVAAQVSNYLTTCEDVGLLVSGIWKAEIEPVLDAEYQPTTIASRLLSLVGIQPSPPVRTKAWLDLQHPENYLAINRRADKWRALEYAATAAPRSVSGAQLAAQYKAWLDMVESETGVQPIIYTSKWMWMHTGNPAWVQDYKLWVAQYPYEPDMQNEPAYLPDGWADWWMWQYSESGQLEGISGKVDLNLFNGTADDWKRFYGGATIPLEPPGETMIAHNPNPLNLRTAPHVATDTLIMSMPANTRIEGTEIVTAADGGKWLKTTVPQAGYCASWLLEYETDPAIDTATITVEHDGKAGAATILLE